MKKITKSVIGSFLVATSLAFVTLVSPIVPSASAQTDPGQEGCGDVTQGAQGGITCGNTANNANQIFGGDGAVFTVIVNFLLFIIGAVSVIMLIIGGIRYTISGGDSSAVTSAKNTILYALIGLVVAFLAYAIVNFVLSGVANNTV